MKINVIGGKMEQKEIDSSALFALLNLSTVPTRYPVILLILSKGTLSNV